MEHIVKYREGKSIRKIGDCEKHKWKVCLDKTEGWLFQGGNTGSNPVGDAKKIKGLRNRSPFAICECNRSFVPWHT